MTPLLVPKYAALTERRLVLATADVEDGVTVSATSLRSGAAVVTALPNEEEGTVAVAVEAPLHLATLLPESMPELTVEIRDTENLQLVADVWPVRMQEALPRIAVPLLKDDPDVPLDLQ